jgi:hypothetical protein
MINISNSLSFCPFHYQYKKGHLSLSTAANEEQLILLEQFCTQRTGVYCVRTDTSIYGWIGWTGLMDEWLNEGAGSMLKWVRWMHRMGAFTG